ncbi:MAG TPA: multicopper oxidase domain-containing protein [Thermoanaerobaculia bacterium]|jgi:FtsP/CotA-like multicopper oxidase with cupredoxin domain|nr:multicopper oxidase domain-containing protein [Thermoanaerobaculia bacterium]
MRRRDVLSLAAIGAAAQVAAGQTGAPQSKQERELLQYLCPPDGFAAPFFKPSPKAEPFVAELFVPPVKPWIPVSALDPQPDPKAHQHYKEYLPVKAAVTREMEIEWQYHPHPPYDKKSWSWGFDGTTPGPTFHARYGEPVLVRRFNNLPPVGQSHVTWALPSTTTHLHNGHTASESDGNPQDWIDPGEFWDYHYGNFPSGHLDTEKLTTLWYHDHRLDFTAANVYAGLAGFYLLFDDQDSNDETDTRAGAWRLPSGPYDVPLLLHDVLFAEQPDHTAQVAFNGFVTDGWLGDMVTVNRRIRPFFRVERRKYRLRILNGGPSRFYQLYLDFKGKTKPFLIITGDGNFQPQPVVAESIYLSVAQRVDVIIDFSDYKAGDSLTLVNRLEQTNGRGPTGRTLDPGDGILRFDVVEATGPDPSRVPDYFRDLPPIDLDAVKFHRTWTFDYDGGLWTINGRVFDPNRIDAGIEQGVPEIWTFRNAGNDWAHPVHSHFTEFQILEINGKPHPRNVVQDRNEEFRKLAPDWKNPVKVFMGGPRRDVATLLPGDEIKVYMVWRDFLGKHVMHCHNVVHEDHSMMIRWDIVKPGQGFLGPRQAGDVPPPSLEERPPGAAISGPGEDEGGDE